MGRGTEAIQTVVYIDSVFALNAATDYLLILVTARLAGLAFQRFRYALAAVLGGVYAAAACLPGWAFLGAAPVKCAAGVGLCLIAFGGEEKLGRLTLLFFTVSCALAGGVLALRPLFGEAGGSAPWALPGAAAGIWVLLAVFFRGGAKYHASGALLPVRVCVCGRVTRLTALYDSGNALTDGGKPVLVVSPETLERVFPPPVCAYLSRERLETPPELLEPLMRLTPRLRPRLLPYHAVGVPAGLLLTVESDWTEIAGLRHFRLRLALSPTALGRGCMALWGGEIGKGARYENLEGNEGHGPLSAGPPGGAGGG